jgi:hypothetical protein
MRTGLQIVAAAAALLTLAGAAGATPTSQGSLQLQYYNCAPTQAARTSADGFQGTWYCGQYNLLIKADPGTYSGHYAEVLIDSLKPNGWTQGPVVAGSFCIDVSQEAPPSMDTYQIYSLEDAPVVGTTSNGMGAAKANDLRRLFNFLGSNSSGAVGAQTYSSADAAAAFEADVWEIINETTSTYALNGGTFQVQEAWGDKDWTALANSWLGQVHNGKTLDGDDLDPVTGVAALINPLTQDYALVIPGFGGAPVPEPVTLAGIVLGLGSLTTYIRRRRGKA